MPSTYNMPASFANSSVEDVNKFATLPYFLAKLHVKEAARWNVWDQLFGTVPWQENMGPVMRGVTPIGSPVGETFFFPEPITSEPKKDIYETAEHTEDALLRWHLYRSKQINFLPSWQAFRTGQIDFAVKDIVRQIQVRNNMFIRSALWNRVKNVFLCSSTVPKTPVLGAPFEVGTGGTVNIKSPAWLAGILPSVDQGATLRNIFRALAYLREDINAPPFEGTQNMPKDNELIKGKYVLIGSSDVWNNFTFDASIPDLRSINLDLIYGGLKGSLWGQATYKTEWNNIRFALAADGSVTIPAPQVTNVDTNQLETNPLYRDATHEALWLLGADAMRTLKVGPPPKPFSTQNMSQQKFYKMNWNGEVRITDQVLKVTMDGANVTGVELNDDGNQLQLKARTIHGAIAGDIRNAVLIIAARTRPEA